MRTKRRKKVTRVTVDFPTVQHRKLKAIAALEGVTLQEYIRSRVSTALKEINISDSELKSVMDSIIENNKDALKRLADK
ncbi:MAG: hypothetical protein L0207_01110 [Chlamydiae bacterium]|nr:hypothetical protein [Chlamydiota bacterium]